MMYLAIIWIVGMRERQEVRIVQTCVPWEIREMEVLITEIKNSRGVTGQQDMGREFLFYFRPKLDFGNNPMSHLQFCQLCTDSPGLLRVVLMFPGTPVWGALSACQVRPLPGRGLLTGRKNSQEGRVGTGKEQLSKESSGDLRRERRRAPEVSGSVGLGWVVLQLELKQRVDFCWNRKGFPGNREKLSFCPQTVRCGTVMVPRGVFLHAKMLMSL